MAAQPEDDPDRPEEDLREQVGFATDEQIAALMARAVPVPERADKTPPCR